MHSACKPSPPYAPHPAHASTTTNFAPEASATAPHSAHSATASSASSTAASNQAPTTTKPPPGPTTHNRPNKPPPDNKAHEMSARTRYSAGTRSAGVTRFSSPTGRTARDQG